MSLPFPRRRARRDDADDVAFGPVTLHDHESSAMQDTASNIAPGLRRMKCITAVWCAVGWSDQNRSAVLWLGIDRDLTFARVGAVLLRGIGFGLGLVRAAAEVAVEADVVQGEAGQHLLVLGHAEHASGQIGTNLMDAITERIDDPPEPLADLDLFTECDFADQQATMLGPQPAGGVEQGRLVTAPVGSSQSG